MSRWFRIRQPLDPRRAGFLALLSFLGPLLTWTAVSYVPWIWHPDVRIDIAADREGEATTFSAGDRVSKAYFPEFQAGVRADNAAGANAEATPSAAAKRANRRILRHLAPVAIQHGWITPRQAEDDAALYDVWAGVADGRLRARRPALSDENLAVARHNRAIMARFSPAYDKERFPDVPLQKLIPQGTPANPVYLPAPHEVLAAGWAIFTTPPENNGPWMHERLLHSVRIVFSGFLLSCLIGVPLGILCGVYDTFAKLFEPFVDFFRYLPAPAFGTLLVAVFLAHDAPKIGLVFIGTFFQLVLVVSKTTRQIDPALLEAAQTLGAKPRHLLGRVVIPGILPDLTNDLRILLGWSWTWLVIAELIGVKTGLTEFIETQGRWRNFDKVYPVIFLIGLLGSLTDQCLAWLRGVIFPYTREAAGRGPLARFIAALPGRLFPARTPPAAPPGPALP
jgi:NitT/TauT family transport system permease protein